MDPEQQQYDDPLAGAQPNQMNEGPNELIELLQKQQQLLQLKFKAARKQAAYVGFKNRLDMLKMEASKANAMLIEIATELNGVEDWKRNKQEVLVYAENVIKQAKERINASHGGQSSDEVEGIRRLKQELAQLPAEDELHMSAEPQKLNDQKSSSGNDEFLNKYFDGAASDDSS